MLCFAVAFPGCILIGFSIWARKWWINWTVPDGTSQSDEYEQFGCVLQLRNLVLLVKVDEMRLHEQSEKPNRCTCEFS